MKPYRDRDWLVHHYYDLRKSLYVIANECGVHATVICYHMKKNGLERRPRVDAVRERMAGMCREKNNAWKGGKMLTVSGYVLIRTQKHPHANAKGYVREHRLIAEQMLSRYLRPEEDVHHINGIKTDNRSENLKIFKNRAAHTAFHFCRKETNETVGTSTEQVNKAVPGERDGENGTVALAGQLILI
ncbi:MAG: HNH endonuclease [Candidatus Aminicenantes bacterium]|nr:HNH endonuclease [Candidatus Aminicenantes bacterium]